MPRPRSRIFSRQIRCASCSRCWCFSRATMSSWVARRMTCRLESAAGRPAGRERRHRPGDRAERRALGGLNDHRSPGKERTGKCRTPLVRRRVVVQRELRQQEGLGPPDRRELDADERALRPRSSCRPLYGGDDRIRARSGTPASPRRSSDWRCARARPGPGRPLKTRGARDRRRTTAGARRAPASDRHWRATRSSARDKQNPEVAQQRRQRAQAPRQLRPARCRRAPPRRAAFAPSQPTPRDRSWPRPSASRPAAASRASTKPSLAPPRAPPRCCRPSSEAAACASGSL